MQNRTNEDMKKIKEILENNTALEHAITLLSWDLETEASALAAEKISKTLGYLTGESYSMIINDEFKKLVYGINTEELSEIDRKIIEEVKKESFEKMEKIPKDEFQKYSELRVLSVRKWEEAKRKNDYSIFKDYLKQKVRSLGGYTQLKRMGIFKRDKQSRSFLIEVQYAFFVLKYARNIREFWWSLLLFPARLMTWIMIFWERVIVRKGMPKGGWERIESTK